MLGRTTKVALIIAVFALTGLFSGPSTANAKVLDNLGAYTSATLPSEYADIFSQNNLYGWNPFECVARTTGISGDCFKVDSNVSASDFWYGEGCLVECEGVAYAHTAYDTENPFLRSETKVDNELGGMQYIYAENYDIDYSVWPQKFTPNGNNSTRRYYWVILPAEAYSTGFAETYVATFENLSEPIYFITLDTHACEHQSEDYCGKANADPDGVAAGAGFLGAVTNRGNLGGAYGDVANAVGKLKSICRIKGKMPVTASTESTATTANSGSSSSSTTSSNSISSDVAWSDGWITSGLSGYAKEAAIGSSYPLGDSAHNGQYSTGGPNKITLHSTDGGPGDGNSGLALYGNDGSGIYPAHFTVNLKDKKTFQHLPITQPSDAVKAHDDSAGVQIEIIGFSGSHTDSPYYLLNENNFNEDDWAYLGELLRAISAETGIPLTSSVDWANPSRLSNSDFSSYQGVLGHMHVPDNDHSDPGNIWPMVQKAIGNNCTSYEGDYPQYWQGNYEASDHENADHDWTKDSYNGGTFAGNACGPTSMAMLATAATGQDIYPYDVAAFGNYVYSSPTDLDPLVGEKYGFEVIPETYSSKTDAYNKIKDYLSRGYMIHLSGACPGGNCPGFANAPTDGHYIGIFSMDANEKVQVANSAFMGNSEVDLQDIIDIIHNNVFTAIKGSGGGSCDNDYCTNGAEDTGSLQGGLTKEQAEKLAEYYNNGGGVDAQGTGDRMNCFSFSMWWLGNFTDLISPGENPSAGQIQTGDQLASFLGSKLGLQTGNYDAPRPYAIFSTTAGGVMNGTQHTGVVTAVHDDGTIDFVDAWYHSKMASGYYNITPIPPTTYVYLEDHVDMSKLMEVVGN